MDPNQPFDYRGFGIAFALVAGLAAALVVGAGVLAGWFRSWLRPRWSHPAPPWNGVALALLFFTSQALLPFANEIAKVSGAYTDREIAEATHLRTNLSRVIVTPLLITASVIGSSWILQTTLRPGLRRIAGLIALGALAWFVLATATFAIHTASMEVKKELGGPIDRHPLTMLPPTADGVGGVIFILSACVMSPWFEEYFFRGLLLPWVMRAPYRPWLLAVWALAFAFQSAGDWSDPRYGAVVFVAVGTLLLAGCHALPKRYPRRTIMAIVSTSLFFAATHSSVWPSPIPLFVLALGLGYLTARTGSIVPAVVVHGLFNAVATILLFRTTP